VSFVLRYDPGYAGVREAVQSGKVGEPISVRAMRGITREESRRVGERGHPLYYMNVHDIDAMQWTVSSQIREVTGVERRGQLDDINVSDVTHATLTFESGAVGTLTGYGVLPNDTPGGINAALELVGTEGTASVDTPGTTLSIHGEEGYDRPDVRHWPVVNGRIDGAVRRQIDHFERAIASKGEMLVSIQDGAHAQAVADAVRQSITDGGPTSVERLN
jgi:predicted dehydrogenase